MSSIVEVEASRVAEILGSAARQLELMALVPSRKRLAAMAAARAERGGASTSAHGRRGKAADPKHASPAGGAEAELLDAFSGLAAAEALAERRRKEALGDDTSDSVAAKDLVMTACKRVARGLLATDEAGEDIPTLESLRAKLETRRAREGRPGGGGRSGLSSRPAGTPGTLLTPAGGEHMPFDSGVDVTEGGEDGEDGAEGGGEGEEGGRPLFALERMSSLVLDLRLAVHARMRTNAEQEAIRREFERTVSARIRDGHAREDLLAEEHRRMELRHKEEEDRLGEVHSKLVLELRDLEAAEQRRRAALRSMVERGEAELRAGADERRRQLLDQMGSARAGLTEAEERDLAEEARLRKARNYQVRDLAERLAAYDSSMKELDAKARSLERDNEELEAHCASIQGHLDLLDENRTVALAQVDGLRERREAAEADWYDRYSMPTLRIVLWHRRLKRKWEAERKASKGSKKKKR